MTLQLMDEFFLQDLPARLQPPFLDNSGTKRSGRTWLHLSYFFTPSRFQIEKQRDIVNQLLFGNFNGKMIKQKPQSNRVLHLRNHKRL